jgi:hypothetical protein
MWPRRRLFHDSARSRRAAFMNVAAEIAILRMINAIGEAVMVSFRCFSPITAAFHQNLHPSRVNGPRKIISLSPANLPAPVF